MEKLILGLVMIGLYNMGFAQSFKFEYNGRTTPEMHRQKMQEAKYINEVMPEFTRYVVLPQEDRILLQKQLDLKDHLIDYSIYPQEFYSLPIENYNKLIYFVFVEISAVCNGKVLKAVSENNLLTGAQKNILYAADLGTDVNVKVKYKYKHQAKVSASDFTEIKEGAYSITVIPESDAQYPGGFKGITNLLNENVFNKFQEKDLFGKIRSAAVQFTITEKGDVVDARMSKPSHDPAIDRLLLQAIKKMGPWKPGMHKGEKVRQSYSIAFSGGGGC
ncbi:MAG TPA: energy transducer TonB [Bacteroidia bacterium]|jgi:TonB family protein